VVVGRHTQPRSRFDLTGTRQVLNVCESRAEALALVERPRAELAATHGIVLRLYVNGDVPNAKRAVAELADLHLPGAAEVEVVDVQARPEVAERERLLALPLLVRLAPPPVRRIIGDLSDHEQVLNALDLRAESAGRRA
jgi:circadian clock protein KaiB